MRSLHHLFLDGVREQRSLAGSGRGVVAGPALSRLMAAQTEFESDIDVLNYALTLEHLEAAFYQLVPDFEFGEDGFGNPIDEYLTQIGEHETAHVETLTQVISDLGGEPVEAAEYDFGVTDAQSFLATAAAVENLGVSAYDGAGAAIEDPGLLTAAGSIAAVEARHAAYLNLLTGEIPFPAAVETPLSPDEVLEAATPFFVTEDAAEDEATPAASASKTTVTVETVDFAFEPAELEIAAGTTVTWTNVGRQPHTATAEDGSFDTGVLSTGKSASHTFTEPGTYPYVCTLHENTMQAVLVVT